LTRAVGGASLDGAARVVTDSAKNAGNENHMIEVKAVNCFEEENFSQTFILIFMFILVFIFMLMLLISAVKNRR
jgi:hypothetical protein